MLGGFYTHGLTKKVASRAWRYDGRMGALRFLLAISVVSAHTMEPGSFGVGGQTAVEIFFLISGFLISFILNDSARYSSVRDFYISRALRIFPLYFVVTGLSAALVLGLSLLGTKSEAINAFEDASWQGRILLAVSNCVILLQDTTFFFTQERDGLHLVSTLNAHTAGLHLGLLTPQAWSLSLELMFYIIAPALVRSVKTLSILVIFGFLVRLSFMSWTNLGSDPWIDRFFPIQISAFAIGALAHKLLAPRYKGSANLVTSRKFQVVTYLGVMSTIFLYPAIPMAESAKQLVIMGIIALALPVLFTTQSTWRFDSFLSGLSFPIYLWHLLVIEVLSVFFSRAGLENMIALFVITCLVSIVLSVLSNKYVDEKIEVIRKTLRSDTPKAKRALNDQRLKDLPSRHATNQRGTRNNDKF